MSLKPYPYTQNRELSWLKFNQRVLEEAQDENVPLLERLKFISIFTSNLDEFYMIRCGSLYDLSLIDDTEIDNKSGLTPTGQLNAIFAQSKNLYLMRDQIYKELNKTLRQLQFGNIAWKDLSKKQVKYFKELFESEIEPLLSPQVIDLHRPFPHLANKELYIFVQLMDEDKKKYGILPIPNFIERIYFVPDMGNNYVLSEQIIFHNLGKIFGKGNILFKTIIRVTRNADISLNEKDIDEDVDYRGYMKKILKRRNRLNAIRLEVYKYLDEEAKEYLCQHLHITPEQVFISKIPLETSHHFKLISKAPKELTDPLLYPPFEAQTSKYLNPNKPIIPQVLHHDVLLNYPYQDIGIFLHLLKEASTDPNVLSIKITIYRLASHSKILDYLCRAADNGKDVTVLMELRARFDEQNNIIAAERLEEAGCTVLYGFEDYKVHSKICLITYKTRKGIETITQIGTGNYNEKTSHQYTDLSYITSNPKIGQDAIAFFQNMSISNLEGNYEELLVSPNQLKHAVMLKLDQQIERAKAGKVAEARFKLNSLTDLDLIKKISEASQAGVKITMIIRGICCMLPGMKNYTENLEIYSIVGRFLEHSRIYIFGPENDCEVYIASADFMTRNTERRVEVGVPIRTQPAKQDVIDYYNRLLKDNMKRRKLLENGNYIQIDLNEDSPYISQEEEIKKAYQEHFEEETKPEPFFKKFFDHFKKH